MRPVNRILALLLGLALAAGAVIVAVEASLLLAERPPWIVPRGDWNQDLLDLRWDDDVITVVCIIALVAGLLLLLAQVWPRRARRLPVRTTRPGRTAWILRRGLESHLARIAGQDAEVEGSRVRVSRRRARVRATYPTTAEPDRVGSRVREVVTGRLGQLELDRPLRVKVRLKPVGRRVG